MEMTLWFRQMLTKPNVLTLAKGRNTLKAATGDMDCLQIRPIDGQA
jgi:hypothetical protein